MNKIVLTIGGSSSDGAAGIQGDLKTIAVLRMYSASVVTSVTAQNTQGVTGVHHVPAAMVGAQMEAVLSDMHVDAVKTGMLGTRENVEIVAALLQAFEAKNIVVDPVLASSSGTPLLEEGALDALKTKLFPLATVITPNLPEAAVLTGLEVKDTHGMQAAAVALKEMGPQNVIITGGHLEGRPMDLLYDGRKHSIYDGNRIASHNTHGTGDAFSAIIACKLAAGERLELAIDVAKKYVAKAINHPFKIGKGLHGPLNHGVPIT